MKTGVVKTATYENGVLHGPMTETFPSSQTIETYSLYNEGNLIKQTFYNIHGMPLKERIQQSPSRFAITQWYSDGTPMALEEYAGVELVEAQYLTCQNEIEARVEKGRGSRITRTAEGTLQSKEEIDQGFVVKRDTFYPNGSPETNAFLVQGMLHGEKKSFAETGEPLAIREYVHGKLHGKTTFFKNGVRAVDIHYLDNMKNGLEIHYIDGDIISQELLWENDHKHGPCKYYVDGIAQVEYFYDGDLVPEYKWKELNHLDQMIGRINTTL
jgi:antitoxin component YwqK of YwqJK toxin-antitoxin module